MQRAVLMCRRSRAAARIALPHDPPHASLALLAAGTPMIDPRVLRDDPDRVRAAQAKRGLSDDVVDRALAADDRAARGDRRLRGQAGRAEAARQADPAGPGRGEGRRCWRAPRTLAAEVKAAEAAQTEAEEAWQRGADGDPQPRRRRGAGRRRGRLRRARDRRHAAREFDFEPRDHVELGRMLGAIDLERGAKVSGSRFYFLTGVGAQLEFALVNMAMDQARDAGFTQVIAPSLVKPRAMEGTGFLGQAADDVYRIEGQDLYLVGTSEVPMAAYHSDEILDAAHAAAALRRVQPVLPQGGRLARQGHPGHHPGALVRQGRDVRLHDRRGVVRRAPAAAGVGEGVPRQARARLPRDRRGGRRPRPVGAAEVRLRGVDPHPGPLPRAHLDLELHRLPDPAARHPRPLRRRRDRSRSRPSTARSARSTRTIVAILETHQQADGSVRVPEALQPYLGGPSRSLKPVDPVTDRPVDGWQPRLVALDIDGTLLKWVEGAGTTYEEIAPAGRTTPCTARVDAGAAHRAGQRPLAARHDPDRRPARPARRRRRAALGRGQQRRGGLPLPAARGRPRGDLRRRRRRCRRCWSTTRTRWSRSRSAGVGYRVNRHFPDGELSGRDDPSPRSTTSSPARSAA